MNTVFLMLKNQLLLNSGQHILISKTAQKIIENLCMFVNTFRGQGDTIITVKTPPIHYIFFTIPIVKYLLLKDSRTMAVFFLLYFMKKTAIYLLSIILLQSRNSTVEMLKLHYKKTPLDLHRQIYIASCPQRCVVIII